MSLVFTYAGSTFGYGIPPTKVNLPQRAELGSISMGGISPEDPAASLALVGHRPFYVEETDCSQPRLFTGWIAERNTGRSLEQGQFVGASARIHDTTIVDLNALFGFRIITGSDGNRPSETIGVRLTWLLASAYLTGLIEDTGKVNYWGGTPMEPRDYRGDFPADVMAELLDLTQAPVNWFAFWDPAPSTGSPRPGLYFDDMRVRGAGDCPISISNVPADIDNATCFAPATEARLERTPETVYSDVVVEYLGASVFRNLASTETAHIKRGTKISRPRTGKTSTATAQGDAYLASHANEVDRITPTIHVPSSVVGLLWAGQRMDVKFSHLPGYTSWTSMQIVASTPRPVDDHAAWYDVDLELVSPRVEATGTLACTTGSLVFLYDSGGAQRGRPPTSFTIPAPPVLPSVMLAFVLADEQATSVTDTVGAYISPTAPWTLLQYVPAVTYEHDLFAAGYLVTPSGTPPDFTAMWTDNGWSTTTHTTVVGVYIQTSATAPVQVAPESPTGLFTLPAPPTEGNLLVLAVASVASTAVTSLTGWQHIRTSATGGSWQVDIFSRCVGAGESATVVASVSAANRGFLSEWALSGVPTTGGTIGPKPGLTTVATTNPTATDDSDHGYVNGVHWVNTTTGEEFVLVDNTVGAAVWTSTTTSGLIVKDEGTPLATAATTLDFVGTGVAASGTGAGKTITIPDAKGLPLGLTGAVAATRYVGGTASGAPTTGTFAVGDFVIDQTGSAWVCTGAGSPGTWTQMSGGGGSVWRDGTGAPSSGLGANGDYYLDDATGDVYLKASGSYSIVANIKGATGSTGGGGGGLKSAKMHLTVDATFVAASGDGKIPVGGAGDWDDWSGMISGNDFVVPAGQDGKYLVTGEAAFECPGPTHDWAVLSIRDTTGAIIFGLTNVSWDTFVITGTEYPKCEIILSLVAGDTLCLWGTNYTDCGLTINGGRTYYGSSPYGAYLSITKLTGPESTGVGSTSGQVVAEFDGGGSALTAGGIVYLLVPFAGTITDWRIVGNATGSAAFDVAQVAAGGSLPAFPTDSIVASAAPSMSGAVQVASSTLTGWTTAIAAGHLYAIKLITVSGLSWVSVTLNYSRP